MELYHWDPAKNEKLIRERGISFEEIVSQLEGGHLLAVLRSEKEKYRHQKQYVVEVNQYAYLVPFVDRPDEIFLKTIIPSRKMTKRYLGKEGESREQV